MTALATTLFRHERHRRPEPYEPAGEPRIIGRRAGVLSRGHAVGEQAGGVATAVKVDATARFAGGRGALREGDVLVDRHGNQWRVATITTTSALGATSTVCGLEAVARFPAGGAS